jgi:hypothetical protein
MLLQATLWIVLTALLIPLSRIAADDMGFFVLAVFKKMFGLGQRIG